MAMYVPELEYNPRSLETSWMLPPPSFKLLKSELRNEYYWGKKMNRVS